MNAYTPDRFICFECQWIGPLDNILVAPDPFDPEHQISACPQCREITSTLRSACHVCGCSNFGSCGEPWPDGLYRWSCYDHSLLRKETEDAK